MTTRFGFEPSALALITGILLLNSGATATQIGTGAFGAGTVVESFEGFVPDPASSSVLLISNPTAFASGATYVGNASSPGVEDTTVSSTGCFGTFISGAQVPDGAAFVCANVVAGAFKISFALPARTIRVGALTAVTVAHGGPEVVIMEAYDSSGTLLESVSYTDAAGIGNWSTNFLGIEQLGGIARVDFATGPSTSAAFVLDALRFEVANQPPVANAGQDQSVRAGDLVSLNGSGSFDDNTPTGSLLYSWNITSAPVSSTATLSGANTATPSFTADKLGTYVVELVVTDGGGLSDADDVMISSDNLPPTAHAGMDQLVIVNMPVFLDGSGSSDPEDDPLTFSWLLDSVPTGSTASLSNATTATPFFTPDLLGVYQATLTVSDFIGPGTPDSVQITATTVEGFAEFQIVAAADVVSGLGANQVTTSGNQNAFLNFLSQAVVALQAGDTEEAINKLTKAIERTDGCVLRSAPDANGPGRDWITDCDAQTEVYDLLTLALSVLAP